MKQPPWGYSSEKWRIHVSHEAAHIVVAALTPDSVIGPVILEGEDMYCCLGVKDQRHVALAGLLVTAKLYGKLPTMSFLRFCKQIDPSEGDLQKVRHLTERELDEARRECLEIIEQNWSAIERLADALFVKHSLTESEIAIVLASSGIGLAPGVTFAPKW